MFEKQGGLRGFRSQLETNGHRNRMNRRGMQRPEYGCLVYGSLPGQVRPEWTRAYQTPNGTFQTDDPYEGAAGTPFYAQGTVPQNRLRDASDIKDPDPATVARELL